MRQPADRRYTITREYTGYSEPRYVLRFTGTWIMQSYNRADCITAIPHTGQEATPCQN
jgi:hypothetical protein